MSSFQKVVKYVGIGFAIFLSVAIIGGICAAIFGFTVSKSETSGDEVAVSETYSFRKFTSMEIDSGVADVIIKAGDDYGVETVDVPESLTVEVTGSGKLCIKTEDNWFDWTFWVDKNNWNKKSKIYVTVPDGYEAEQVAIYAGTGNITMSDFDAHKLEVDGGVGNINGSNIKADEVEIDAGVGNIEYEDIEFGICDVDSGVGNVKIKGILTGDCDFDGGVGDLELKIEGSRKDFDLDIDTGTGSVRVNGDKVQDLKEDNGSKNKIVIDGGVGSIQLDFTQD